MTAFDTANEGDLSEVVDEMLPTTQAALIVGVTPQTLRRMERRGKISATRDPEGIRQFSTHECLRLSVSGEDEIFRSSVHYGLTLQQVVDRYKERKQEEAEFIPADEAAVVLGKSRATLRRWELSGKLVSRRSKYTKHVLYSRETIAALKKEYNA